jgi:protoporphyrinogen/coproporphyrinogen III oxidase
MRVVVVGAGLAGLAAAWELSRAGADVLVLDAARRSGGVVVTEAHEGFIVEGGPDGFLAAEPDIPELAREVGVADRLVDQLAHGTSLWTGHALEPLSEGRAAALLGIQVPREAELALGFQSFAGGMADLVRALVERLSPAIQLAQGVTGIAPVARGWRLSVTGGSAHEAEAVVLAVPAWTTARFLMALGVSAADELGAVVYAPSHTVSLAYREDQLSKRPTGAGFVASEASGSAVRACSYASLKYPGRAPQGHALLRAFLGPIDGDAGALAHAELGRILGIQGAPLWTRAFYLARGLPRYRPAHAEHARAIRSQLMRLRPLAIAGAGCDGAGVSACVKSGRTGARLVLARLGASGRD